MPVAGEVFPPLDDQATLAVERRLAQVAQRFDAGLRDRVTLLLLAAAEALLKREPKPKPPAPLSW